MKHTNALTRTLTLGILAVGLSQQAFAQDSEYGPTVGDWEVTLGGQGSNNQDFDGGQFGMGGSLGYFFTDSLEVVLRQGFNFSDFGNSSWGASTRVGLDYHFDLGRWRPFVGANFGGLYGDNTSDSFAAGLEVGVKYYVKPKTFVFAMGEYEWLFDSGSGFNNNFDDGAFLYNVGIGFNF